jgi:hypothetical protein
MIAAKQPCLCCALFLFCETPKHSLLKVVLQLLTVGAMLLKIQAFLSIQMLQHMMIIISIAKGIPRQLFMRLVALSGLSQVGTTTPIVRQQMS